MVLFNYSTKELTAKIVYYGPGLCGKTTNLQFIHGNLPDTVRGKMLSLATKTDRTLFFDFLPIDLGQIRGMKTRVQLYTVPGQVFYNETRKLVLKGADGIVFVADSQQQMLGANAESFKNLEENLKAHGMTLADMPHVIQFNKRDLPGLASIEEMNTSVNMYNAPFYETVATTGIGIQDTLKAITKLVLLHLTKKYDPRTAGKPAAAVPAAPKAAAVPSVSNVDSIPLAPAVEMPGFAESTQPTATAPLAPVATIDSSAASPEFDESEIDGLVNEVEETYLEPEVAPQTVAAKPEFEIDASGIALEEPTADPQEVMEENAAEVATVEEIAVEDAPPTFAEIELKPELPAVEDHAVDIGIVDESKGPESLDLDDMMNAEEPQSATVQLTEVQHDSELFNDPDLDVARLEPGDERAIIVPVELVGPDGTTRRFKLSLSLRMDPVDDGND